MQAKGKAQAQARAVLMWRNMLIMLKQLPLKLTLPVVSGSHLHHPSSHPCSMVVSILTEQLHKLLKLLKLQQKQPLNQPIQQTNPLKHQNFIAQRHRLLQKLQQLLQKLLQLLQCLQQLLQKLQQLLQTLL